MSFCCECCQIEASASGSSLFQGSPTDCCVSECDREGSIMGRHWSTGGLSRHGQEYLNNTFRNNFVICIFA